MLNHRKFDAAAFRSAILSAVLGLGGLNFAPLAVAQTNPKLINVTEVVWNNTSENILQPLLPTRPRNFWNTVTPNHGFVQFELSLDNVQFPGGTFGFHLRPTPPVDCERVFANDPNDTRCPEPSPLGPGYIPSVTVVTTSNLFAHLTVEGTTTTITMQFTHLSHPMLTGFSGDESSLGGKLSAGRYYLGMQYTQKAGRYGPLWRPEADALGGVNNPITFPSVANPAAPTTLTATHGDDGVLLTWQKPAHRHSRFSVYYNTNAGVTTGDSAVVVNPDCADAATSGQCTVTIPYADLSDIDATTIGYFRVEAGVNFDASPLSAEVAAFPPAVFAAQTYAFVSHAGIGTVTLPSVRFGGTGCTYAADTTAAADLLGLTYTAGSGNNPPSLSGAANQVGSVNLGYSVSGCANQPDPASVTLTINVRAGLDTAELAKTALPDIVLAMADSTASGIKSRISEVRRGCSAAAEFSLDGATDFASIVQSQAENEIHGNRNWRRMLGNSKFAVSHDNDSADSGFCGIWGQGNFQNLDGEHSGVKWDGSLSGFALGADTRLGSGKLLGIAVNNQSGAFDITKDATTSQYDVALSSVSPYLGWQSANGTDFHASLSVDSGEGEIKTRGNVTKHDLSGFGVGFGFRSSGALKGDLVYSSVTAEESVTDGADISESVGVGRLRLAWERSRQRVLASGASLNLNGEIGGRADTGTAGGGFGAELGFGFGYAKNSLKFGGNLRTLLFHSGDVGEFGAQIRLSIQPGQDGQGLSLNIAPTYGQTASSLANLWENGISKITAVNPDSYQTRVNARLGFGFSFVNSGLVTPYATARYGDLSQFGFGVNWKPKLRDLELDLLGEQIDTQQRILLKGSLGF